MALDTVADYMREARVLLQDTVPTYRYGDDSLISALNLAIMTARRNRPDLFMEVTTIPQFVVADIAATKGVRDGRAVPRCFFIFHGWLRATARRRGHTRYTRDGVHHQVHPATDDTHMSYATDRLIKNARVSLPGSLDNVILLELFNVAGSVFQSPASGPSDISFSVYPDDPADTVYYIEPESVSAIVRLLNVANLDGMWQRAVMDIPGEVTFMTPVSLQEPDKYNVYTANVVLSIVDPMQRDGYPEFPAWTLEKHGMGILRGLLGRMMSQPAKPYTNKDLAAAHLVAFRRVISTARTESVHRNVNNGQAWVFPQSFRTRSRR